jgi:acyl dehydratase
MHDALYFEDIEEGAVFLSRGRTVTEADNVIFTGLSGNYHSIHTDEEFAKKTQFGQRVVHGVLGLSIVTGLQNQTYGGIWKNAIFLELINWKFLKPIFIGDTLTLEIKIASKRTTSKPQWGIVQTERSLFNQRDEKIQTGLSNVMVWTRKGDELR